MIRMAVLCALALCACRGVKPDAPKQTTGLQPPDRFLAIADPTTRSRALFTEASRVLMHPRCVNCHPDGDTPRQGMSQLLHEPPVVRGPDNHGVPGNQCETCHQDRNQPMIVVPGAPKWALAPLETAWYGKSANYICEQLKDPKRNHHMTLAQIVDHSAHDPLVAWGWSPGNGREPAPGTQAEFGALMAAWADTGAACPLEVKP
jgi:hypothetical protein